MCRFWQDMCYKSCLVPELLSWQTMKTFSTLTFLPIWSLSLSLLMHAHTHILSILKDSLVKKCVWTTLHLTLRCVLYQCYFKGLISIRRIIMNHWFGLFFQCVYHAYAWALWENYSGRWCGWGITHSWTMWW